MPNLDCLIVCTSGNFLAPALVAGYTVNKLDLDNDKRFEEEDYGNYQIIHYKKHYRIILPQIFYLVFMRNYKVTLIQIYSKVACSSNSCLQSVDSIAHNRLSFRGLHLLLKINRKTNPPSFKNKHQFFYFQVIEIKTEFCYEEEYAIIV